MYLFKRIMWFLGGIITGFISSFYILVPIFCSLQIPVYLQCSIIIIIVTIVLLLFSKKNRIFFYSFLISFIIGTIPCIVFYYVFGGGSFPNPDGGSGRMSREEQLELERNQQEYKPDPSRIKIIQLKSKND